MPAKRKAKIFRPETIGSNQFVAVVFGAPPIVRPHAFCVKTYVDLPGDNAQRRQRWSPWKETVREDFKAFAKLQLHPGLLVNPRVHIHAIVGSASDPANQYGRYKFLVDMLQPYREIGGSRHGLLGLIVNDKELQKEHITVTEVVNRKADENGLTSRSVALYVWGD